MINGSFGCFCCRVANESVLLELPAALLANGMPTLQGNILSSSLGFFLDISTL